MKNKNLKNHQTWNVWWSKCNAKTVIGLFAKLGIDFKGIYRVLCRFVELESVSNTSKKLLKKFGILGILGILGMPEKSSIIEHYIF